MKREPWFENDQGLYGEFGGKRGGGIWCLCSQKLK